MGLQYLQSRALDFCNPSIFLIVVQIAVALLVPNYVLGGELVGSDIIAAQSALFELGDQGKDYQFEPYMSGCIFKSCSTELVRFRRTATFTKVISEPNAVVVRKRKVWCYADEKRWKCYPDAQLLTYAPGLSNAISIAPAISDATVLGILYFFGSECFRNQADAYNIAHRNMPEWALRNIHIYSIELRGDSYGVGIWGLGVYVLKDEASNPDCGYVIQSFGILRV